MSQLGNLQTRRRVSPQTSEMDQEGPADPVEVYCRVRPLNEDEDESCCKVLSDQILQITPPDTSLAFRTGHRNATQHTFQYVFNEATGQREVFDRVSMPLVRDLFCSKNGLLFTYGITNSGKTYTMSGEPDNAGILPRCLDIIFNSIAELQAPRFVFKPDKTNGFEVQSEGDARVEAGKFKPKKISAKARSEMPEYSDILRLPEVRKVDCTVDEDCSYSVFVSYVEIYNNYVFDLLEDIPADSKKPPQSKGMREDARRQMYISGVTEVEVKSTEEAYEALWRGQRRRRVGHTQLNHESSRSHSIFTIRLVSAPLDSSGEEVVQDKGRVVMTQLSLVDLAGSERATRTGNQGNRLREANNINANLMVLRTCMETLRDNQGNAANKIVPYRDAKLTHLFKNYFDGDGKVKMVVCVSPRSEDYDETIHVMRFAEVTQEVQIQVEKQPTKLPVGYTPGRRRANLLYKAALKGGRQEDCDEPTSSAVHPYHLALPLLCVDKFLGSDSLNYTEFRVHLEDRAETRQRLLEESKRKETEVRSMIVSMSADNDALKARVAALESQLRKQDRLAKDNQDLGVLVKRKDQELQHSAQHRDKLQKSLSSKTAEALHLQLQVDTVMKKNANLERALDAFRSDHCDLEKEMVQSKEIARKEQKEKEKIKKTMKGFVHSEKEKFEKLAKEKRTQDQKLQQVMRMVQHPPTAPDRTPLTETDNLPTHGGRKRSISENWLNHRPTTTLEGATVLQPNIKKKKTITTPKPKHFKDKHSKYMLTHQELDVKGRTKTKLFKGDILESRGGGHSVRFTNIESLDTQSMSSENGQNNPTTSSRRSARLAKKSSPTLSVSSSMGSLSGVSSLSEEAEHTDVETRCAVGIMGKPGAPPGYCHMTTTDL
uniref:Kinesin-like protein protein KIF23 n=1 Tax=Halisarca dujardinii TaxID=2583056 RepID=A0AA96MKG7_HALDU|nr:kinesin-like protein protein KIF23 [Halisarca dujardinii]